VFLMHNLHFSLVREPFCAGESTAQTTRHHFEPLIKIVKNPDTFFRDGAFLSNTLLIVARNFYFFLYIL
jgi:hypothetical protein